MGRLSFFLSLISIIFTSACFGTGQESLTPIEDDLIEREELKIINNETDIVEEEGAKGFFWKINNEKITVYLLGSFHIGIEEMYPMNQKVYDAFEKSDYLVLEINHLAEDFEKVVLENQQLQVYNDGTTLQEHISVSLYNDLLEVLPRFGLEENEITFLKPWAVRILLEILWTQLDYDFELGVEEHFKSKLSNDKKVKGLEYDFGMNVFDSLSPDEQENQLLFIVNAIKNDEKIVYPLDAWITGDFRAFEKWANSTYFETKDFADEFNKKLILDRNKIMVETIEIFLNENDSKSYFVIAGAAHFVGEQGIVKLLQEKGYILK